MQAAYTPGSIQSVALYTQQSRRQVRRCIKAAALAYLHLQERFLAKIARNVEQNPNAVKFAWERVEFDETRQWMHIDSAQGLLPCQQRSAWNVLAIIHWVGQTKNVL